MARWDNLNDPIEVREARRTRALEGQAPLGHSSITRGGLRIASEEGLRVEGSILGVANNDLGIPALLDWRGTATFTGDVTAKTFHVGTSAGRMRFDETGLYIDKLTAPNTWQLGTATVSASLFRYQGSKVEFTNLPELSSGTGKRVLVLDGNEVKSAPWPTGVGGGDPTPWTGDWPHAPFSYASFADNNWDGEADYGPRSIGKGWHDGIDFSGYDAYDSAPVRAIGPGTVIDPSYAVGWGGSNPVMIDHGLIGDGSMAGHRLYSVYAHMWTRLVGVGATVAAGQTIGTVGNDGESYGSHLHLELHINSVHMYGVPGVSGSQDPVPIFNEYGGWP